MADNKNGIKEVVASKDLEPQVSASGNRYEFGGIHLTAIPCGENDAAGCSPGSCCTSVCIGCFSVNA